MDHTPSHVSCNTFFGEEDSSSAAYRASPCPALATGRGWGPPALAIGGGQLHPAGGEPSGGVAGASGGRDDVHHHCRTVRLRVNRADEPIFDGRKRVGFLGAVVPAPGRRSAASQRVGRFKTGNNR